MNAAAGESVVSLYLRPLCSRLHTAIAQETGHVAEVQVIDLTDFASVVAFSGKFNDDPIDILVANAGVTLSEYSQTKNGWEET